MYDRKAKFFTSSNYVYLYFNIATKLIERKFPSTIKHGNVSDIMIRGKVKNWYYLKSFKYSFYLDS